ncbi:hypothetical protein [Pontibacter sp. G13]|uniref:hypothetical protein n=1 Tax=Pontibacter sp. G13 TaxID=3074898 RepID=UPI00288A80FE|nr:hypothetical protein [Pontibacter sp. G13]WNJ20872.1 hypothetical protein RJD25_10370 [Pontibacter sp. G13]
MNWIDIRQLDDQQWEQYFHWHKMITRRFFPREYVNTWTAFRDRRLANLSALDSEEFLIYEDQIPIAWLRNSWTGSLWECAFNSHLSIPSEECVLEIRQKLEAFGAARKLDFCFFESGESTISAWMDALGAQKLHERSYYEWIRETADFPVIEGWVNQFQTCNPDISLKIWENRPDEILDQYIELYDAVCRDIPLDYPDAQPAQSWPKEALIQLSRSNEETEVTVLTASLQDASGQWLGLSDLNIHTQFPKRLYQGMTGVHAAHRGNRWGRWMKWALILEAKKRYPKFQLIESDCHAQNAYVQRMNESMGFVQTGTGAKWRWDRDGA